MIWVEILQIRKIKYIRIGISFLSYSAKEKSILKKIYTFLLSSSLIYVNDLNLKLIILDKSIFKEVFETEKIGFLQFYFLQFKLV